MLRVRRGKRCLMIYDLFTFFKAEKRKVKMGDAWFRVLPLSLSLSELGLPSFHLPRCREICLLYRFSLLIGSIFFREGHEMAEKLLLIFKRFLTNFVNISPCAGPMRRSSFFPFWRKSQHREHPVGAGCNYYLVCTINQKKSLSVI